MRLGTEYFSVSHFVCQKVVDGKIGGPLTELPISRVNVFDDSSVFVANRSTELPISRVNVSDDRSVFVANRSTGPSNFFAKCSKASTYKLTTPKIKCLGYIDLTEGEVIDLTEDTN